MYKKILICKTMNRTLIIYFLIIFLLKIESFAQKTQLENLSEVLDVLSANQIPELNKEVDISVNDLPLKEYPSKPQT